LVGGPKKRGGKNSPEASFGNNASSPAHAYQEVFYLSPQMMLQPQNSSNANLAAIHYAIWQILDPGANLTIAGSGNQSPGSSAYWLGQAIQNYASVNTADFVVYTPTVPSCFRAGYLSGIHPGH
jgi:hypothetical protein